MPTEATDCRIAEIDTEIAELTRFDKEWLSQLGMIAMRYEAAKDIPVVNHNVDIASLMAERSKLENEREISLEDNEHLFIAWNIPTATTDNGRQFDLPEFQTYFDWQHEVEETPNHEDVFPDDLIVESAIAVEVHRVFNGRTKNASMMLGYLIGTKPGHVWTREALTEHIYHGTDGLSDYEKSRRAGCLMSNYWNGVGSNVPKALYEVSEELGGGVHLVMQIGRRYLLVNGKRCGKGVRVCRAVDISEQPPEDNYLGRDNTAFDWATPGPLSDPKELLSESDRGYERSNEVLEITEQIDSWVEPVLAGVVAKLSMEEIRDNLEGLPLYSKNIGSRLNCKNALSARIISQQEFESRVVNDTSRAILVALLPKVPRLIGDRYFRTSVKRRIDEMVKSAVEDTETQMRIKHLSKKISRSIFV